MNSKKGVSAKLSGAFSGSVSPGTPPDSMFTGQSPEKQTPGGRLRDEIATACQHEILRELLSLTQGLVVVLDEELRVIALNVEFLRDLGIASDHQTLGLRLGELLNCGFPRQTGLRCGETPACETCGAAIALNAAKNRGVPQEQICVLGGGQGEQSTDRVFRIQVKPFSFRKRSLQMAYLQDVTREQRGRQLERIFFHDVRNLAVMMRSMARIASEEPKVSGRESLAGALDGLGSRLSREIDLQRCLLNGDADLAGARTAITLLTEVMGQLERQFAGHPLAEGKILRVERVSRRDVVRGEAMIVLRILENMVLNALEASAPDEVIRVRVRRNPRAGRLEVWNPGRIPAGVVPRIFQKNFSTKGDMGRGLGTFSMKLLGEQVLGGTVGFVTSARGTVFGLELPWAEG
jgi:hypothetical protein